MLPVTVSPRVLKTLNDRQFEFNKKCEAIKQIFMDPKSNSCSPLGLRWAQRRSWNLGEVDAPVRQEPTYIEININIKLSNANKIVMLSQTHGYNQFVRFPKTVKSINMAGSFDDLKTVTGSRPMYKRLKSVTNV